MKTRKNRISVYEDFCQEMNLFIENQPFPDWIFDYREHRLSKNIVETDKILPQTQIRESKFQDSLSHKYIREMEIRRHLYPKTQNRGDGDDISASRRMAYRAGEILRGNVQSI